LGELDSIHTGKHEIEDEEPRLILLVLQTVGGAWVGETDYPVPLILQKRAQEIEQLRLVVDDDHRG
jgi:hypothetical protein